MVLKKEIVYPVFLECCKIATDKFWENTFEDLAYGKPPYGTYINKNFLVCKYKNKEFSYKIERKDPDILYNEIYKLLTKRLGLLSNKEKIKKKLDFYKHEKTLKNSYTTWASIKKKNIKDILIERYVIEKKNEFNLTIKQARFLLSVITISIIFKVISQSDVMYKDGKILSINGINFSDNHIILKRNIFKNKVNISYDNDFQKISLIKQWPKFIESLK